MNQWRREKRARGGRNAKRGRRGTGRRRSRRACSVQVVAGIPDQYFHRFSGGYRQVASSLAPFPTLIPLSYSDDAISFSFPSFPSFYRALSTPVVRASSLFLFDLLVLRSFPLSFCALFSRRFSFRSFTYSSGFLRSFSILFCFFFPDTKVSNKRYGLILILFSPLDRNLLKY